MDFYTIEAAPMRGLPGMMEVAPWFLNTNSRDPGGGFLYD
nr:MAG TPA: hypothetical protein [Caudoviricetes sp.]